MHIKLKAFGIARDILGGGEVDFQWEGRADVTTLQKALLVQYPRFQNVASIKIAVNEAYGLPDQLIGPEDEIVVIPPVSGG